MGWRAATDAGSGSVYYYNTETGESRWDPPPGLPAAPPPPGGPPAARPAAQLAAAGPSEASTAPTPTAPTEDAAAAKLASMPRVDPAAEAEDLPPGFGPGASVPLEMRIPPPKSEHEKKMEEENQKLPFNGAPIGTVINTIKANTPAGCDPVYPEGYEPKYPSQSQVKEWMKRPARKQKDHIEAHNLQQTEVNSEYNIWYGKYLGDRYEQRGFSKAPGRCAFATDVGWTQAVKRPDAFMCIHWARGVCAMGKECGWLHRPPTIGDQMRLPKSKDCFGRDRHATHRDDMSGVGNFMQDTRTLYVGRIRPLPHDENYEMVYRNFSEWGDLEEVRVIDRKSIAFIRYTHRIYAEFAREAMMENNLDGDEILNVRWAYEDPNPKAIEREKRERLDYGIQRLQEMGINTEGKEYDYPDDYQMPPAKKVCTAEGQEYPDTDRQFPASVYQEAYEAPAAHALPGMEDYEGAGPLTPAQMKQKQAQDQEQRKQALAAQRLKQEESDRQQSAVNLDSLLDRIGGAGPSEGGEWGGSDNYAGEHRQELFDQQQAAAEGQPMVGAWGYYSANYEEAQKVHRNKSKPQHPAAGYVKT